MGSFAVGNISSALTIPSLIALGLSGTVGVLEFGGQGHAWLAATSARLIREDVRDQFLASVPGLRGQSSAAEIFSIEAAKDMIESFRNLGPDWDAYGARPISNEARSNAKHFFDIVASSPFALPIPEISPKSAGTISFEWETDGGEAYVEIGKTRFSGYIKMGGNEPAYLEGRADALGHEIVSAIYRSLFAGVPRSNTSTQIHIQMPMFGQLAA